MAKAKRKQSAKGSLPMRDPGPYAVQQQALHIGAILKAGDVCTIWSHDDDNGRRCRITESYGWKCVKHAQGRYTRDGMRFNYQLGYAVVYLDNGEERFAIAGELVLEKAPVQYSHLRLVHNCKAEGHFLKAM